MDRIIVALGSKNDEQIVRTLIEEVGLALPGTDFESDKETASGIRQTGEYFGMSHLLFLVVDPNDDSSNRVTQETFESVVTHETTSCLEKLVKQLEGEELESDIWFVFAYSWGIGQDVVYYEGDSSAFGVYLRLNGGAFRTTYNLTTGNANIDLDTPLVWKLRSARQ